MAGIIPNLKKHVLTTFCVTKMASLVFFCSMALSLKKNNGGQKLKLIKYIFASECQSLDSYYNHKSIMANLWFCQQFRELGNF